MSLWVVLLVLCACGVNGKIDDENDEGSSGDHNLDDSMERIGPVVTQVYEHPYAATLNKNDSYVCSAVILNVYWLLTVSKCFDAGVITSYVTHKNLSNYSIRAGSSYNNKAGDLYKLKMMINNFDQKVSAIKLETPMVFSSRVQSLRLPNPDEEITLGFLASIIAWTPTGHMRVVNAPAIDSSICEATTPMLPGHYICLGGVQDPNRHFCRRDNGGAVVQNNTLIGISSFINTCALYSKTHAFPKVASFVRWLDSIIWDEEIKPSSTEPPTTTSTLRPPENGTRRPFNQPYYADPGKFMLTLPFDPINVPLEPALEDNSVLPGISLYESYLQSIARAKTSTLETTKVPETKTEANQKSMNKMDPMMIPQLMYGNMPKKYDRVQINGTGDGPTQRVQQTALVVATPSAGLADDRENNLVESANEQPSEASNVEENLLEDQSNQTDAELVSSLSSTSPLASLTSLLAPQKTKWPSSAISRSLSFLHKLLRARGNKGTTPLEKAAERIFKTIELRQLKNKNKNDKRIPEKKMEWWVPLEVERRRLQTKSLLLEAARLKLEADSIKVAGQHTTLLQQLVLLGQQLIDAMKELKAWRSSTN